MEPLIAILVGIILIILSTLFLQKKRLLNKTSIETEGIVYDIVDSQSFSLKYKTPIIRFVDL